MANRSSSINRIAIGINGNVFIIGDNGYGKNTKMYKFIGSHYSENVMLDETDGIYWKEMVLPNDVCDDTHHRLLDLAVGSLQQMIIGQHLKRNAKKKTFILNGYTNESNYQWKELKINKYADISINSNGDLWAINNLKEKHVIQYKGEDKWDKLLGKMHADAIFVT
eukprot:25975_1